MNCIRCNKIIEQVLEREKLCKTCFFEAIEHRARKTLKEFNLTKGNKVLIIDDHSKESAVSNHLFRKITAPIPLIIETKKKDAVTAEQASKDYTAIVVPWDMDDETASFITAMINNQPFEPSKTIRLLKNIYDREVKLYSDLNKFTYTEHEKTKIHQALENLEQKHPAVEIALLNSIKAFTKKT